MEASFSLVCNNKKVIDFYKNHPNLDFESMNLIFISIMENLTQDMNSSLNNNIATQLLTNIQGLQTQINFVSENVIKLQSDTILNFSAKFSEFKKEYIEDLKMILTNNSVNTIDRLTPLIKDYNSSLIDKTQLMLNDVVPKNNDNLTKQLKEIMTAFHSSISEETNQLLKTTINNDSLSDFINKMENKFLNTQTNTQQLLNAIITSTEHRLDSRINEIKTSTEQHIQDIKHLSSSNQSSQSVLQNNVYELLKKMEISSVKGKCSENILFNILQSLYSTAQIDIVGEQKETGDFMLMRKNKPTILIENKNWNKNVIQDEVKKFIRDVETQNCCGLFLSQNFGIANKENFEINIHNGHILLYVHEVNNDAEKIKIAIDIIDNFKLKLDEIVVCNGDGYNIDKEVLDEINKEYQLFATQKLLQIKMVKDFSSKMVKQLEDLNFPCLEHFLSTKYAFSSSKYICEFCDYVAKNQSAMSAHKRGCKTKNVNTSENNFNSNQSNMSNKTENNNSELTINQNIQSSTLNVVNQNNVLTKEKQTKKSVKK
jgi:hypothetical protein